MDVVEICTDPAANRHESPERHSSLEMPKRDDKKRLGRLRRFVERCRDNVWFPVAIRATAMTAGMLGLATIGVVSVLSGPGLALDVDATALTSTTRAGLAATWLKPTANGAQTAAAKAALGPASAKRAVESAVALAHPHQSEPKKKTSEGVTADGKIVLNLASAEELTRLPGVGMKRAQSIVKLRTRLKRFRRVSDLLRVRGIGVRSLRRLKPLVVLDPPTEKDGKDKHSSSK